MENVTIEAERRSVIGKQVKALRREGKLPAVLYGFGVEPTPITLNLHDTTRALHGLSSSAIVTIALDGKKHNVLVRDKQIDFIRGTLRHIDFLVVSMNKPIRTQVMIELTGESPAVADQDGVLVQNLNAVEVEALPGDLPERFTVDISHLAEIGSALTVADLTVPKGVTVLTPAEESLAVVTGAVAEIVEEEAVEAEAEEPEVIERGKKEEDEEETEE